MALSAGTKEALEACKSLFSDLTPRSREILVGLAAIGYILFTLTGQSPEVPAKATSVTSIRSEGATEVVHVRLPDGSFSDRQSSDTTVTTTRE